MKIDKKLNSQVRTAKEKLVMENFASVMKKLDATIRQHELVDFAISMLDLHQRLKSLTMF